MNIRALALACCLLVQAGCQSGEGSAPTGQVVATVDGEEITIAELNQEVESLKRAGQVGPSLQTVALQSIVTRKQLAAAARDSKLDLLPDTVLRRHKMEDMVLVEALSDQIRKSVPAPAREEAEQYVREHPASFAQRRIFILDQLVVPSVPADLVKELLPLETQEQVVARLDQRKIAYNKTVGVVDSLNIDAEAAEKMAALPPGAVFISPDQDENLRVNVVRDMIVQPLPQDQAIHIALERLRSQRSDQMVENRIDEIANSWADKVKYNPAFAPKKSAPKPGTK